MGPTGERLATIEANTENIKESVGRIEAGMLDNRERLDCQEQVVDRHTLYWKIVGGVLGLLLAGVGAWVTGLVKALISTAAEAVGN